MSMTRQNGCRDLFVLALRSLGLPLPDLRICELGCQRIKTGPDSDMRRLQSSRSVLDFLGAEVVSIDLNGAMGSRPLDLSRPLPGELLGRFDLVTNFGTLEHVRDSQLQAWRNAHDLCRPGGLMAHAVPHAPSRHGCWQYTAEWCRALAERNRYGIVLCERWFKRDTIAGPEHYVRALWRRFTTEPFCDHDWTDPEPTR